MRIFAFLFLAALTVGLVIILDTKDLVSQGAPPVGKFISPFHGFWQNCDPRDPDSNKNLSVKGLKNEVNLAFDDRLVPHIFARNDYDLYFMQGYVTAQMRLWQMEIQTHFASGRLSEIMGEDLLPTDRFFRRIGMVESAKKALTEMEADSTSNMILEAYTKGVNAYINQLAPPDYPFEYKLLDYAPEKWTKLKCALLLKYMAFDLTGSNRDVAMTNILHKYGQGIVKSLFPDYLPYTDPIIPSGTKWDFDNRLSVPRPPALPSVGLGGKTIGSIDHAKEVWGDMEANQSLNGSNNWAVNFNKSASGYPILANDPHLSMTLPSLWFEIQLSSPTVNVYGASLPGAPGIISGFTEFVSWGITNTGADVLDWYKIEFQDDNKEFYRHGDRLLEVFRRIDTLKIRGKASVLDTVYSTHHGPVVYLKPEERMRGGIPIGCALKWAAHEPSNELLTFYYLNRAKTYTHYLRALTYFDSPAQNFVFADNQKTIAIRSNGKFPLKWQGQGKFILDGTDPKHDWQGFIPKDQVPGIKNPERGFVSSANQAPTDTTYPYYLDYDFESFERGKRINARLDSMQYATTDSFRNLQNDNYNLLAEKVLPKMLKYTTLRSDALDEKTYNMIKSWNYRNDANSVGASVFHLWWYFFQRNVWEDDFPSDRMIYPSRAVTAKLITQDTVRRWWDDVRTKNVRETFPDQASASFHQAVDSLKRRFENQKIEDWTWANLKATYIPHLTRNKVLRSLGRFNLPVGGGVGIVNATSTNHGPSWRMVVSMGPYVRGFGVYPGGQSGHPASKYYDNMVDVWVKGELEELNFMRKFNPEMKSIIAVWKLTGE